MKILIVTSLYPPDIGGPATYLSFLSRGLVRRGHRLRVLSLGTDGDKKQVSPLCPVDRIDRNQPAPVRIFKTVREILRMGRKWDLLFSNGLLFEVSLARSGLGLPVVAKVVGDMAWEKAVNKRYTTDDFATFQHNRYGPMLEGLKLLQGFCLRMMDRIITPSDYLKRTIISWGVRASNISVISNAVSPSPSPPEKENNPSQPLTQGFFKVLYVGRLIVCKRIDQIIQAVAQSPKTMLTILGDGPEKENLKKLAARPGVVNRVHFQDSRPHDQIGHICKSHHCLVLNSTHEGYPHVILEAQSAGIPVLATATGGTLEMVQHRENGWLIDPHEGAAGVMRGIGELSASSRLRRNLARNAARTSAGFSLEKMVEATEALFMDVIERHRIERKL